MPAITLARRVHHAYQRGAGLIEVMVGILIGMIVVLVIYNTLIVAETFKRSTLGASDAQITGQLTHFVLGRELASGGNGLMAAASEFSQCDNFRLRPIPVMIEQRADSLGGDQFTVFIANSRTIVHPVRFAELGVAGTPYPVISPNGFKVGDWVIASKDAFDATECTLVKVTGITQFPSLAAYPPADFTSGGGVALSYTLMVGPGFDYTKASRAVNLGQNMTRTLYSVDTSKMQLNSFDDNPGLVGVTAQPVAQNVVLMKVQYGVDAVPDLLGLVDCWTNADNSNTCANGVDYSASAFTATPAPASNVDRLRSIKAIRIAIIVRSEDDVKPDTASASLLNQSKVLFDCPAAILNCTTVTVGNTVLEDYRRYRVYETTIPLRNSLWNQL